MSGDTMGAVRLTLRMEGLLVLIASVIAYAKLGFSWGIFSLCFFIPDLSLLGYFAGAKIGALTYNIAHSYIGAIACLTAGFLFPVPALSSAGIIWCAHIGFDRTLGYGLKYSNGFGYTHLGRIGRFAKNTL